jgi:chromosome segregation ATPase
MHPMPEHSLVEARLTAAGTKLIIDTAQRLEAFSESMAEGSKVDEALAHFEAALRRLEAAVMRGNENGNDTTSDTASLLEHRDQLSREINEVRAKASELAERNRNAASKIDSAMAKIKSVLG